MSEIIKFANDKRYVARPAKNGVYYINWSDGGRSKRQSTGTKDVQEAQAFLDEWVLISSEAVVSVLTVGELWEIKYPAANGRYSSAWKSLQPHFGHLTVQQVTQKAQDDYAEARDIAPSTLRLELSLIRAAINNAVRKRLIDQKDVPVWDPLPAQSPPRDRWLSDDEAAKLLEAAKYDRRVHMFCNIALETGARRTAIQRLQWQQVDFAAGVIHLARPGEVQTRKKKPTVPMSKRLRAFLAEEKLRTQPDPEDLIIGGTETNKINPALDRVAAVAGINGVTPHVLRHTAATRMARAGIPLWHIAKVLGNTVEMVEEVYAKWQPEMLQGAVDSISGDGA